MRRRDSVGRRMPAQVSVSLLTSCDTSGHIPSRTRSRAADTYWSILVDTPPALLRSSLNSIRPLSPANRARIVPESQACMSSCPSSFLPQFHPQLALVQASASGLSHHLHEPHSTARATSTSPPPAHTSLRWPLLICSYPHGHASRPSPNSQLRFNRSQLPAPSSHGRTPSRRSLRSPGSHRSNTPLICYCWSSGECVLVHCRLHARVPPRARPPAHPSRFHGPRATDHEPRATGHGGAQLTSERSRTLRRSPQRPSECCGSTVARPVRSPPPTLADSNSDSDPDRRYHPPLYQMQVLVQAVFGTGGRWLCGGRVPVCRGSRKIKSSSLLQAVIQVLYSISIFR
ncbi:hypothetical protein K466DRAFT_328239 [Polyporus arcularius HHB13444]|uniref:Uncharacterized protein n=1 Tax=Polyporus arcularius HHB13444 TaxID=1314778 RepID=A0A5C3NYW8_9APHY|nr:hypothetical protein K466DRAFT_328239 [Polyporus arcularius HHB13444]